MNNSDRQINPNTPIQTLFLQVKATKHNTQVPPFHPSFLELVELSTDSLRDIPIGCKGLLQESGLGLMMTRELPSAQRRPCYSGTQQVCSAFLTISNADPSPVGH